MHRSMDDVATCVLIAIWVAAAFWGPGAHMMTGCITCVEQLGSTAAAPAWSRITVHNSYGVVQP